jgi:hypothetical protein
MHREAKTRTDPNPIPSPNPDPTSLGPIPIRGPSPNPIPNHPNPIPSRHPSHRSRSHVQSLDHTLHPILLPNWRECRRSLLLCG